MASFIAFRTATAASLFRTKHLPTIFKCRVLHPVLIPVRHAARREMPGSNHLRDRDIPHRIVQLANEDGRLEPQIPLSHILASIDSKTHFVELVSGDPTPIVKIQSKKEHYEKQKAFQRRQKEVATARARMEIQMTWNIEPGDLAHKLGKARKEFDKGNRVDLVFAPKVNQKPPHPDSMIARLDEVLDSLSDIAAEWSPRKMENGVAVLYLQRQTPKGVRAAAKES